MISRKVWSFTLVALLMLFGVTQATVAQVSSTDSKKVTVTLVRWPYT